MINVFDEQALHAFGWRLLFLFGGLIGIAAIIIRRDLPNSEHFKRHELDRGDASPLIEAITTNRKETTQGVLFASGYGAWFYIVLVYLLNWLHEHTDIDLAIAMRINTAATALMLILIPMMGWVSDRFVRRQKLIACAIGLAAICALPPSRPKCCWQL